VREIRATKCREQGNSAERDVAQAARDAAVEGQFVVRFGGYRVDMFTSSIPFFDEAARTRVRVSIDEHRPAFLSAEPFRVAATALSRQRKKAVGDGAARR
jgi:hypothetical protein